MSPIYECLPCQRQFQSQAGLISHIEKKHPEQGEVEPSQLNLVNIPVSMNPQQQQMKPMKAQQMQRAQQREPIQQII